MKTIEVAEKKTGFQVLAEREKKDSYQVLQQATY
jgi:hypothetical protein